MNLIINLGLKSIRGIIFDDSGDQIYSIAFPVHTTLFKDHVEQDANEWLQLIAHVLSDIQSNTNLSSNIKNVTVTTSSSCIVGVDKNGKPLTKVLMVSDKRSILQVNAIKANEIYMQYSGELLCSTSSLIPKALWFKENKRELYDSVDYWLGAGELLNFYFTGQFFTDPLNAGKAFYAEGNYNETVLSACDFPVKKLPKVLPIGSIFEVKEELKIKFSLALECKFVLSTYDAICAVIGSSTGESTNACDVSGTVTSVRLLGEDENSRSNEGQLLVQPLEFLKKTIVGASNNLGGGIIEWFKQAYFDEAGKDVYPKMQNLAEQSIIGAGGVIFLPFLLGERAPFFEPNATGTFFGINRGTTLKDFTRAAFESTAFVTRHLIESIENSGYPVNSISVSGGLARFDLINQIKSDVCNKPVHVIDNFESTSIGAYILMGLANGLFKDYLDAVNNSVKIRKTIYPSQKSHMLYDRYFSLYKELNETLFPLYHKQKDILKSKEMHRNEIVRNL